MTNRSPKRFTVEEQSRLLEVLIAQYIRGDVDAEQFDAMWWIICGRLPPRRPPQRRTRWWQFWKRFW